MPRYVCIHGHFYQPPRENPWLEQVELMDSAYPFHDWNERITSECYAPNAASRILDAKGHIAQIVNNYAAISFNFGPTLLSWLERSAPITYAAIIEADRLSQARYSGHGSALAQPYNHTILPMASERDRRTQLLWGLSEFRRHFEREPKGMWLPEAAADVPTLEALSDHGIAFTVLSPYQAARWRPNGAASFHDAADNHIDPKLPYVCRLPSGREITLFFYDAQIAKAVAFERLLDSGDAFARRLMAAFDPRDAAQLVHIATDGESYGHHHAHGDMALAYAIDWFDKRDDVALSNYAAFLEKHPPQHEVELLAPSSWSCAHGIERWRSDCGCGGGPESSQAWRAPLRAALDGLRDELNDPFERAAGELFRDPWAARDDYIAVIADRSPANVTAWLDRHAKQPLAATEQVRALELCELERHLQLMYTSCGWFFEDLARIETIKVIEYAARAVQLGQKLFGDGLEQRFLDRLASARSNDPSEGTGADIYARHVLPTRLGLPEVAAHYAVLTLFDPMPELARVYCYEVRQLASQFQASGRVSLSVGRASVQSTITRESETLTFAALHLGDHNVAGGVRRFQDEDAYRKLASAVLEAFGGADLTRVIHAFDEHFAGSTFSIQSLFRDDQRRIVSQLLRETVSEAEAAYSQIYEQNASLMLFLSRVGLPVPKALEAAAERALNGRLRALLEADEPEFGEITRALDEAKSRGVALGETALGYALGGLLERLSVALLEQPGEPSRVLALERALALCADMPFQIDLWDTQRRLFALLKGATSSASSGELREAYRRLAEQLELSLE